MIVVIIIIIIIIIIESERPLGVPAARTNFMTMPGACSDALAEQQADDGVYIHGLPGSQQATLFDELHDHARSLLGRLGLIIVNNSY